MQVKAWCYYESRLLGAHHGLLSTYALETMVLYLLSHHPELDSPLKVGMYSMHSTTAAELTTELWLSVRSRT